MVLKFVGVEYDRGRWKKTVPHWRSRVILIRAGQPIEVGQLSAVLPWLEAASCRQPSTATSPEAEAAAVRPRPSPGSALRRRRSSTTRHTDRPTLEQRGGEAPHCHPELINRPDPPSVASACQIPSSEASIDGGARRRVLLLLLVRRRYEQHAEQEGGWLQAGAAAFLGRQLRHQDCRRLLLPAPGRQATGASYNFQRGEAQGGVRRGGAAAAGQEQDEAAAAFPQSLHSDPLRLHGQPDAGRDRAHDERAAAELAGDAAEGRRGGRVEGGGGRRGDGAARALLRQRRQPAAGAGGGFQILRLLQGATAGPQGGGSWRRGAVRGAAGADGGQGVGALPLQVSQVQPDGVLGAAQGGHQEEPAGRAAERNRQEAASTQVGEPGDNLQRPGGSSPLIHLLRPRPAIHELASKLINHQAICCSTSTY